MVLLCHNACGRRFIWIKINLIYYKIQQVLSYSTVDWLQLAFFYSGGYCQKLKAVLSRRWRCYSAYPENVQLCGNLKNPARICPIPTNAVPTKPFSMFKFVAWIAIVKNQMRMMINQTKPKILFFFFYTNHKIQGQAFRNLAPISIHGGHLSSILSIYQKLAWKTWFFQLSIDLISIALLTAQ